MKLKNDIPASKLTNALARLFRRITDEELDLNISTWQSYLDDYIRKLHPDNPDNMKRIKTLRSTALGNITDAIRRKESLTFKKLVNGLYIIKATQMKVTLEVDFQSGKKVIVSETVKINDSVIDEKDDEKDE